MGERLLRITLDSTFAPGHAELRRSDDSVLAEIDDGDDRAAFLASFEHDEAAALVLSPDLFESFTANADRALGRATTTRH